MLYLFAVTCPVFLKVFTYARCFALPKALSKQTFYYLWIDGSGRTSVPYLPLLDLHTRLSGKDDAQPR